MFGKRSNLESSEVQADDRRLSALLREWKGIEPHANFEASVWRRIHAVSVPEQRHLSVITTLGEWFVPRTAWVNAVAVAAGIAVGVGMAVFTSVTRDGRQADEPLLSAQTLAGSYLAMTTGERR